MLHSLCDEAIISETELAWAAGLWDGEGCTSNTSRLKKGIPNKRATISMGLAQSTDKYVPSNGIPKVLERFHKAIYRIGVIRFDRKRKEQHRDSYKWTCHGYDCVRVFNLIGKYLSREKVEQFLNLYDVLRPEKRTKRTDTHCVRGHKLTLDNLYPSKTGSRHCIKCQKLRWKTKRG